MEQKVIITDNDLMVNEWLSIGWTIVSVTAQYVSTTGPYANTAKGAFCFVIQKQSI